MTTFIVTHIRRDGADLDRRIDRLAGPSFNSSIDEVIGAIERGHSYFVEVSGVAAYLEVKTAASRRKYLRTIPDGY